MLACNAATVTLDSTVFNKLFTKILDSSIWLEPAPTRIVWITLLAAMDEDGYAHFSAIENLAARARVTPEEASKAVECFTAPDPNSGNPDNEGRRVERVPGGFLILNAKSHRDAMSRVIQREQTRLRVAKFRAKKNTGFIYYAGVSDLVKIGFSESPWRRIEELQRIEPRTSLLGLEPGSFELESKRHRQFAHTRKNQEWFVLADDLRSHIAGLDVTLLKSCAATGFEKSVTEMLPGVTPASASASERKESAERKPKTFHRPTIEEVKLVAAKSGLPESQALQFYDYYESNGWRVGKNPMKSWTSALANWQRTWRERTYENNGRTRPAGVNRNAGTYNENRQANYDLRVVKSGRDVPNAQRPSAETNVDRGRNLFPTRQQP